MKHKSIKKPWYSKSWIPWIPESADGSHKDPMLQYTGCRPDTYTSVCALDSMHANIQKQNLNISDGLCK